jgi:hypothetical protein
MTTPTVTELTRRPEPVVHDTFIDDLVRLAPVTTRPPIPNPPFPSMRPFAGE